MGDEGGGAELTGLADEYLTASGPALLGRWTEHQHFWNGRLVAGLDPYFRTAVNAPGPVMQALSRGQETVAGVNFATQDHLSLASHPAIHAAASNAIARWGVHSGGPMAMQGATPPLMALEDRLADVLNCREVTVFPSGWAACSGAVRTLVRESDHVVIDALAPASLQDGASSATGNVHRFANCSHFAVAQILARIRERDARAGILVITASLFAVNAFVPDLRALHQVCRDFSATLMVDVSHDFGSIGEGGLGFLGEQCLIGQVDLIVGSFAHCFASNGGFVASQAPGIKQALRTFAGPLVSSSTMSPVQAAVVNAALTILRSREGADRRNRLMQNARRLRETLAVRAFRVLGQPAPIVPVWLGGPAEARQMTSAILEEGALVNLTEYPQTERDDARWCLLVMADHSDEDVDRLVTTAMTARNRVRPRPIALRSLSPDTNEEPDAAGVG